MKKLIGLLALFVAAGLAWSAFGTGTTGWTLVGWNDLGMHCMDGTDFSVFAILPPFNTIHAQLMDSNGNLVTQPGITVTYEAIPDPTGSLNTTSAGKTNFWDYVAVLFGASPPVDTGLAGNSMPGSSNTPQPMVFDSAAVWYSAVGIPVTPLDDVRSHNPYPMMRLTARDSSGNVLATTDIVVPVSEEMDCRACHASNSDDAARPAAGWVNQPNLLRDIKLNILRLHDDRQAADPVFQSALAAAGYNASGLYATVVTDGTAILCAKCHGSNALPGTGIAGVEPHTQAMHTHHATVVDPLTGLTLDASSNRTACYRCHPGSTTRCLRGVMGNSIAPDGTMAIQCQSCHGIMSQVGSAARQGWLQEPNCQNCHTGTAVLNSGQLRYTTVFDSNGEPRVPADLTFASNANVPASGLSLYRFSYGHGGLACESCHGSTHAELASSHANDNVQSIERQGHVGMLVECGACHSALATTANGGPHGIHTMDQPWVDQHGDIVQGTGTAPCQACHGVDYLGTVLSRSKADRVLSSGFRALLLWKGFQVSCYACHNGPGSGDPSPNQWPTAADASASTIVDASVVVPLLATDPDGDPLALRIISQPAHGAVALAGTQATYFPDAGFLGSDSFTFSAWDGFIDSNLATVTLTVGCDGAHEYADVPAGSPFQPFVCLIARNGITAGCGGANFCPADPVTRAPMAVFLLRGKHGAAYAPPPATGTLFTDVPADSFAAAFIEQLAAEGITSGCGNGKFCPNDPVTRAQMAVFLLRARYSSIYQPPPVASATFADVPVGAFGHDWIEELHTEGIAAGCASSPMSFCPGEPNTRGQMSVFLTAAFRLQ